MDSRRPKLNISNINVFHQRFPLKRATWHLEVNWPQMRHNWSASLCPIFVIFVIACFTTTFLHTHSWLNWVDSLPCVPDTRLFLWPSQHAIKHIWRDWWCQRCQGNPPIHGNNKWEMSGNPPILGNNKREMSGNPAIHGNNKREMSGNPAVHGNNKREMSGNPEIHGNNKREMSGNPAIHGNNKRERSGNPEIHGNNKREMFIHSL